MKQVMRNFATLALVIGVIALLITVQPALADNLYGSIRGTVIDPSGAALAGATVTATNTDTDIVRRETTSPTGGFVFQQLAIGNYKVSVTSPNFKTYQAGGIHLDLDQVYSLNVKLEVGAVSEAIQVEANPVQVETTSMQLGTVVTGSQIVDIPLNGRNWTQLMQLEPGVQSSSDRFGNGAYSTNGSETQSNSFLINGTDSNDVALNTPLVIPSPDAIGDPCGISLGYGIERLRNRPTHRGNSSGSENNDDSFGSKDHGRQGRHRRHTQDRSNLRHALYRLAL